MEVTISIFAIVGALSFGVCFGFVVACLLFGWTIKERMDVE